MNKKDLREFHKSLKAHGKGAKGYPNTHTEVEYLGNGKFGASISVGHRVFFDKVDGNIPKKHKLTDERPTKDYVLIQGAKCCIEVYPYYAKYYDVQHEEVRLYEERWVVQRWKEPSGKWSDIGAWNPVINIEEYSESAGDVIKVTINYETDYGDLTVEYFQRDGNALKHNITFKNTSGATEKFRVVQKWAGIVGSKCNGKNFPVEIDELFLAFSGSNDKLTISENLYSAKDYLVSPISVESHAQGMKADFIYGDWELAQNESLEIDPATATLDNPTVDGIAMLITGNYSRNIIAEYLDLGWSESLGHIYRGYVEWDVSGIVEGSTVTSISFKYHGKSNNIDCHIHEMVGCRPSIQDNDDAGNKLIYDEIGEGITYAEPAGFPVVATEQTQSLGANGITDLESQLSVGWFAIGIQSDNEGTNAVSQINSEEKTDAANPKPTLYVEYIELPTVITLAATDIEDDNATGNGEITNTGGENCDIRGIVWNLATHGDPGNVTPAVSDYGNDVSESNGFGIDSFTRDLISLPKGDIIYARAYAHNSAGYAYGEEINFTTKPEPPEYVAATDGNHSDRVTITWQHAGGIVAGYNVYEGENFLGDAGYLETYDDFDAPAGTVTPGDAVASDGTIKTHVVLSLDGEGLNNGATRTYKVLAYNTSGESDDSNTDTGYRTPTDHTYQWQRSSGDADEDYSNIDGATTEGYNDEGAPESGDGRYYKCVENATGATEEISGSDRGYRESTKFTGTVAAIIAIVCALTLGTTESFAGSSDSVIAITSALTLGKTEPFSGSSDSVIVITDALTLGKTEPFTGSSDSVIVITDALTLGKTEPFTGSSDSVVTITDSLTLGKTEPFTGSSDSVIAITSALTLGKTESFAGSSNSVIVITSSLTLGKTEPFSGSSDSVIAITSALTLGKVEPFSGSSDSVIVITNALTLGKTEPFSGSSDSVVSITSILSRVIPFAGSSDSVIVITNALTIGKTEPFTGSSDSVVSITSALTLGKTEPFSGSSDSVIAITSALTLGKTEPFSGSSDSVITITSALTLTRVAPGKVLFNSKFNAEFSTKIPDGLGGFTIDWYLRHSNIPCRIRWLKGNEKIFLNKNTWIRDAKIYCAQFDIKVTDRIIYANKIYEIVNIENPDDSGKFFAIDIKIKE